MATPKRPQNGFPKLCSPNEDFQESTGALLPGETNEAAGTFHDLCNKAQSIERTGFTQPIGA